MKCGVCGRVLKNPDSRKIGYGPVCYKRVFGSFPPKEKVLKAKQADRSEDFRNYVIPGQMQISDFLHGK